MFRSRLQKFVGQKIQRGKGNFLFFQLKPPNCFASGQRILDFINVGIYRLQIREQLVSKSRLSRKRLVFTVNTAGQISQGQAPLILELCPPGKSKVGTSFKECLSFFTKKVTLIQIPTLYFCCAGLFFYYVVKQFFDSLKRITHLFQQCQ